MIQNSSCFIGKVKAGVTEGSFYYFGIVNLMEYILERYGYGYSVAGDTIV